MVDLTCKSLVLSKFTCSSHFAPIPSVNWSADNHIAVITSKGVYILCDEHKPHDNGSTLQHKYFIANPEDILLFDVHQVVRENLQKADLGTEQHKIMLDHSLLKTNGSAHLFLSYRYALWSPLIKGVGCLLALLTFDHRLQLYIKRGVDWVVLKDVSELLYSALSRTQDLAESVDGVDHAKMKEIVYKISAQHITWTSSYKVDDLTETCFLVCASKCGYFNFVQLTFKHRDIAIHVIADWTPGLGPVTCLYWFKDYLMIGSLAGQMQVLRPQINVNAPCAINLELSPRINPWVEKDDLAVNQIQAGFFEPKLFWIVFTKSTFLMICKVEETLRAKKPLILVRNVTLKEAIYKMPSSGACLVADNTLAISSLDGRLVLVTLSKSMQIEQREIKPEGVAFNNMCPCGLTSSPNKVIVCLGQCLSTYHDHLTIKEPSQVIFFVMESFESITNMIDTLIKNSSSRNVPDVMDLLQAFYGYLTQGYLWIPEELRNFGQIPGDVVTFENPGRLKLLRFVGILLLRQGISQMVQADVSSLQSSVAMIECYILKLHIENILSEVKTGDLSRRQQASLANMRRWLQLEFDEPGPTFVCFERCPICKEDVDFVSKFEAICPKDHKFTRCCNSLLISDLSQSDFLLCRYCGKTLYAAIPVWQQQPECAYCC